jgi:hypothetical protein
MLGSQILLASLAFGLARASVLPEAKLLPIQNRQYGGVLQNCNTAQDRSCWMNGRLPHFDASSDSETTWPVTNNEVKYDLHISKKTLSPDGNSKEMLVINGKYPGTLIEARKSSRNVSNRLFLTFTRMGGPNDYNSPQ